MTFTFRPAVRENTPLIIGLAGPSKSGKTYSAFRLATGMANGGVIAMINTEGARGHMYAGKFTYETVDLGEPFSYERYREAVLAARELKPAVLIIDSVSHAHEGSGGMLDQHEKYLDKHCGNDFKKRERNTWTAWIKPKAEETLFVNTMIQVDFPIILCFRAKEKLKIVRGAEPVPMGWQPICSDRIPFETTATLILPPGSKGAPDLSAQASELREPLDSMIRPDQINEELGARLQEWAKAGKKTAVPQVSRQETSLASETGANPDASSGQPATTAATGMLNIGGKSYGPAKISVEEAISLETRCKESDIKPENVKKFFKVTAFDQLTPAQLIVAHENITATLAKRMEAQ